MSGCIAWVSPLGGTAQTTLMTSLADVWAEQGRSCLAVELTAQNSLGLQCGLTQAPDRGWLSSLVTGQWWGEAALENSVGLRFLPLGDAASQPQWLDVLARRLQQPDWLLQQLQQLDLTADTRVLLDAPAWPSPMAQQALRCADLVVLTLDVSPRAVASQAQLRALLAQLPAQTRVAMVLTRFNPRREAQAKALQTLRAQWSELLSPHLLHDDESVPLAQAQGLSVTRWAPQSQSAHDLQGIAQWLLGRLAASPEAWA